MKPVRRFITGHNLNGKSILISDANAHDIQVPLSMAPDLKLINLWRTDESPADVYDNNDPTATATTGLTPLAQGSVFRMVDFPPDATYVPHLQKQDYDKGWEAMQASDFADHSAKPPHPMMHATPTLDYGIVLEGEIYLLLDEGEYFMKAGDVVIQRATNHAWSNRSDKLCRMAFILIDAAK